MSPAISLSLRKLVIERAGGHCEYCLIHQDVSPYVHEADHIIACKHGGQTISDNLALACLPCNRHKGSDLTSFDPTNGKIVPLFNPRTQSWINHFTLKGNRIVGLTPTGRATVTLLAMNAPERLLERQALVAQSLYP